MTKHRTPAARAQKGETLAEVLVALLIVALAALLLASMVSVAAHMNITAREKDEAFYQALTQIERLDSTAQQTGTVFQAVIEPETGGAGGAGGKTVNVTVYSADGLTFYTVP